MTGPSSDTPAGERQWTRRRLLRTGVGTAAITVAGSSLASGQENDITTPGVIPDPPDFDESVVGFFIHIKGEVDPIDASPDDECDFVTWADEATMAYDARLVDGRPDPRETRITLYLHEDVEVVPGTLFIINNSQQCSKGYLGVHLERFGADPGISQDPESGQEQEVRTTASGSGPGFGALGALAGALGVGWLLGRDGRD